MLNYDKHKEEIDKIFKEGKSLCEISQTILKVHCLGCNSNKEKYANCKIKTLEWLCQEHIEPILSDEEKEILNQLVVANSVISNKKLLYVQKVPVSNYSNKSFLLFRFEDSNCVYTARFNTDCIFKRMEERKRYILEELGL